VLYDTDRAHRLASTFRDAVAATDYATSWMLTTDPLPKDVLVEYARVACLCQLRERPAERDAVYDALFGEDPDTSQAPASAMQSGGDAAEAGEDSAADVAVVAPSAAVIQDDAASRTSSRLSTASPRSSTMKAPSGRRSGRRRYSGLPTMSE